MLTTKKSYLSCLLTLDLDILDCFWIMNSNYGLNWGKLKLGRLMLELNQIRFCVDKLLISLLLMRSTVSFLAH